MKTDSFADLRGVSCPLNYVKTKLKLEDLLSGQTMEVLLDDGEPIINVPRSLKEDGHKILEVKRVEDHYSVIVQNIAKGGS